MLWIKAFHVIAMVAWFAGLFYCPRLFVYHADAHDTLSDQRFQVMERRLYYGIMWPAAIVTTVLGIWLMAQNWPYYKLAGWMHLKLLLVAVVWVYHLFCGHYAKRFRQHQNDKTTLYYRVFNEMPTILLIAIVILVVVKPML